MTHRCLSCYDPIYENSTDGFFCFDCSTTLNLKQVFYDLIKGLDKVSKTWLEFERGKDYTDIRLKEGKSTLGVSYDHTEKDYTIYIKFGDCTVFLIGRKTVTVKAIYRILNDHAPIFGNRHFE